MRQAGSGAASLTRLPRRLVDWLPETIAAVVITAVILASVWFVTVVHAVSPLTTAADLAALIYAPGGAFQAKVNANQRINVLLLAHGGAGNDDPNFTDTMLVLSIRPATHHVTLISLPRYLLVQIPAPVNGYVDGKIYSAFAIGATRQPNSLRPQWRTPTGSGDLAAATVSATIGQPIDYWVAIDTHAFEALIDAVGGVRVTIPATLDDPTYPSDVGDQTIHIHFDPGTQTLDGRRALQYARSRLTSSESDRARRQELVFLALMHGVRTAHVGMSLLAAIGPLESGLRTDLLPADMLKFGQLLDGVQSQDVTRMTIDQDSPFLTKQVLGPDDFILVPRDGNYSAMQQFIAGQLP